jgi:DNA-binding NarL/FixJ family response regulator
VGTARFLLVDSGRGFRKTFARATESLGELVVATSTQEALARAGEGAAWSAFFVDTYRPDRSTIGLVRSLRSTRADVRIAVVSGVVDREFVNAVADVGAFFFLEPVDVGVVDRFLEKAAAFPARIGRASRRWADLYGLTNAEADVLRRAALGEGREAIVEARESSPLTLQKHVSNLLRRTQDDSLQSAVARLLREVAEVART